MRAYARGHLSRSEYRSILMALLMFWQQSEPQSRNLSEDYYTFLKQYRAALCADAVTELPDESLRFRFDEIAFFYLLLGSSHGARFMLQRSDDESLPRQHLRLLADRGKHLWDKFLHENLAHVERTNERQIIISAQRMFECLYAAIDAEAGSP